MMIIIIKNFNDKRGDINILINNNKYLYNDIMNQSIIYLYVHYYS